ncbi:hypothetical protein EDC22_10487 [Tepidamorphus gemmatus]|uniref:DUF1134 domain-containing protein n=1 Tax=Tepidamorphus gemmatus TaxID=747076 RepID=A0A4R3MCM6_9HYPH|nr:hypothetical protein [Tepidamorphus gemmatus]TCT11330.1 hypothetical protein EDC22_10487 [Tepidamorphus gemmatus]
MRKRFAALASAVMMLAGLMVGQMSAHAGTGQISMELVKAAFIVGGTGGKGTLVLDGRSYPLSIGGLSAGYQLTLSVVNLQSTVKNINRPEDIEGIYSAAGAGLAVAAGGKAAVMVNAKGVTLELIGTQLGVDLSVNLEGLSIALRR